MSAKHTATPRKAKSPIGSRWSPLSNTARVFVVIGAAPGGHIHLQEEGRAYFIQMYQRDLIAHNTRLPDTDCAALAKAGEACPH